MEAVRRILRDARYAVAFPLLACPLVILALSNGNGIKEPEFFDPVVEMGPEDVARFQERAEALRLRAGVPVHRYRIRNGDNYWTLARDRGVGIDAVVGANPYFNTLDAVLDEEILLLEKRGVLHPVREGESVAFVASVYDRKEKEIREVNVLGSRQEPAPGDVLFIPDAQPIVMTESMERLYRTRSLFQSPIAGAYTSMFGYRTHPVYKKRKMHKGIDIRAKVGTHVGAAADGVVVRAGWVGGYGKTITIRHAGGYRTNYGHLSRTYVRPGQRVRQGQIIGKTGNTGTSTGPHLDFAILKDGRYVDPAQFIW